MRPLDPRIVGGGAFVGLLMAGARASWMARELSAVCWAVVAVAVAELVANWRD